MHETVASPLLTALMESASDAVFVVALPAGDDAAPVVRRAGGGCEAVTGVPASQIPGRPLSEVLGRDGLSELLRQAAEGAAMERELPGGAGQAPLRIKVRPLSGTGEEVLVLATDLGPLRDAESRLAAARQEAERTSHANTQILSALSYELRTPLNTIIGFSDMMVHEMLGPIPNTTYRDYAGDIARSGRQMLDSMNNLLTHGHLDELRRAETGYRHIIELAPDMICVVREGRLELLNPAGANILGAWPVESLLGKPLADFVHPDYHEVLENDLESLLEERIRVPMKFVRLDGHELDVEVAALPYLSEGDETGAVMLVARDITERNKATEEVLSREARLRRIMDTVVDGIITVDEGGVVRSVNRAAATIFGHQPADIIGGPASKIFAGIEEGAASPLDSLFSDGEKLGGGVSAEGKGIRADGHTFPIDLAVSELKIGKQVLSIVVVRDITERKRNEERLLFLATRDPLTGLPNHALFRDRLEEALERADRKGSQVAILFVDLDHFKTINDALGHPVGDRVLQMVGERLIGCVREGDLVARLSGDEFTIIVNDIADTTTPAKISRKILDTLGQPFDIDGRHVYTSGSIGVILYPEDANNISDLMMNVDMAAYHAKDEGRNNYQFYTDQLGAKAVKRLKVENGLRRALERGEFHLLYQPKIDIGRRTVIGAEALIRWNSEEMGPVFPDEFIPIAEDTGLIVPIGEWVLREACNQIDSWKHQGFSPVPVAVNLSGRQFRAAGLASRITEILEGMQMPANLLELELTESTLVNNAEEAIRVLNTLKDLGIAVSVDDFGTGYSSLSYLKRFPIDAVKIDRSFIMDIPEDQDDIAITRAIVGMAKSLGMKVIAEGVEKEEQVVFLNALECDQAQGYFFSRPVPADQFARLLTRTGPSLHAVIDSHRKKKA